MLNVIDDKIFGGPLQLVEVELDPGQDLFLAGMRRPGKICFQSLTLSGLAGRIAVAGPVAKGERRGTAGIGGNFLDSLISGE